MPNLAPKEGETIIIGDDIKITVLNIKGSADPQIKIGIDARQRLPFTGKKSGKSPVSGRLRRIR